MNEGWISVNGWDEFQHVDVKRGSGPPPWIKNYTRLLNDDDYLSLTAGERSILHGVWLVYASSQCRVNADPSSLTRRLNLRVRSSQLLRLEQAGFITIVASKLQAEGQQDASALARARVEVEEEEEKYVSSRVRSELRSETQPDQTEAEEEDDDLGWSSSNGFDVPTREQRQSVERSDEMSRVDPSSVLESL